MNIGNVTLDNNIFLAPMAGITDKVFRRLCRQMGCGLVFTEMITADGLMHGSNRSRRMIEITGDDIPIGVQVFGNSPQLIADSCRMLDVNKDICLFNLNMGCPVRKLVRKGQGVALMRTPKLSGEIVREAKKATGKPVTVKFRLGFNSKTINALEFAVEMERAGADAVIVHGRTGEQMYTGKADWDIIKRIKEEVKIPVIGNGDLFSAEDVKRMFAETGCDGVMIARGALGNPWIFREICQSIRGEEITPVSKQERIDFLINHMKLSIEYKGERLALLEMRKHLNYYTKEMPGARDLRRTIHMEFNADKVFKLLEDFKTKEPVFSQT